jgi:hypothetical protein
MSQAFSKFSNIPIELLYRIPLKSEKILKFIFTKI